MTGQGPADPDWAALAELRERITGIDTQVSRLLTERNALVGDYERHRVAILGRLGPAGVPAPSPQQQEWSGARVRSLLLWLGTALLAISAVTFTAVAWSRLGEGGRAVLLLGVTALVTALALTLRHRLPATAEAFAGLAIILMLVDVYALGRAGLSEGMSWQAWWAIGTVLTAGFAAALGRAVGKRTTRFAIAALLPIAPELLAQLTGYAWQAALVLALLAAVIVLARTHWARHLYREDRAVLGAHAVGAWLAAAVLATLTDGGSHQSTNVTAALPPALAVAALAVAPALASRRCADRTLAALTAALALGTPAAVLLTLTGPVMGDDGQLTTAVIAGGITLLAGTFLAGTLRSGALIAGVAFMAPGALWALFRNTDAVFGPLEWLADPWTGSLTRAAREVYLGLATGLAPTGSWPAVGALACVAAVGIAGGLRLHRGRQLLLGIGGVAVGVIAAAAPVTAGATVLATLIATGTTTVLLALAAARLGRRAWAPLPGAAAAAVPTIGWAAVSPAASVVTLAVMAIAAGAAAVIADHPAARAGFAAMAGLLVVAFTGVAARAAGAGIPAAGLAATVAAGAIVLFAAFLMRHQSLVDISLEAAGAGAAAVGLGFAAGSTPWLAGALTALVPIAALVALRTDRRVLYGAAGEALALAAVWAWLSAAHVDVVEAYTAPAALAALAAGILQWRNAAGRSWLTLGPAIVLAIGPTLALGVVDDDLPRLIVAAVLSLAVVIGGAVWRLQAPLCLGAAALLALAIDQWGDEIVAMPRWISVGAVGVLLMWIGATFEARRRDWRKASQSFGRFG